MDWFSPLIKLVGLRGWWQSTLLRVYSKLDRSECPTFWSNSLSRASLISRIARPLALFTAYSSASEELASLRWVDFLVSFLGCNNKVIISAWAIAKGGIITWHPPTCRSLDWHLHMIAYELLEKSLMCKRWIEPKRKNWDRDTHSNIVRSDQTLFGWGPQENLWKNHLPRIWFKLCRYVLDHQRNGIAKYDP
jgi:hypothetical protein